MPLRRKPEETEIEWNTVASTVVYADDVNLLGGKCRLQKYTEALVQLLPLCGFRPLRGRVGRVIIRGL